MASKAFKMWALLGSNQRPPDYESGDIWFLINHIIS